MKSRNLFPNTLTQTAHQNPLPENFPTRKFSERQNLVRRPISLRSRAETSGGDPGGIPGGRGQSSSENFGVEFLIFEVARKSETKKSYEMILWESFEKRRFSKSRAFQNPGSEHPDLQDRHFRAPEAKEKLQPITGGDTQTHTLRVCSPFSGLLEEKSLSKSGVSRSGVSK